MLEARDLVKRCGDHQAIDGVSFQLERGESFGLLGPNGAGKSTTLHMLVGALVPDVGRVLVDGRGAPIFETIEALGAQGCTLIYSGARAASPTEVPRFPAAARIAPDPRSGGRAGHGARAARAGRRSVNTERARRSSLKVAHGVSTAQFPGRGFRG